MPTFVSEFDNLYAEAPRSDLVKLIMVLIMT